MLVHNNRCLLQLLGAALLLALATFSAAAHQAESTQPVAINSALVTATGTVAELTVKNQLTSVTLRYFGLKVDQGASYALTGTGLDTLSDGSRINVTGTLAGSVFNVTLFSSVAPADIPARATPQAKTKKTISGTLAVYHKDFFDQGRGEYGLAVREASGKPTQLNVAAIPDSLEIGMLISVDGTPAADSSSLDVSSITILAPPPAGLNDVAATPVTNNVLVLPIKFTDSPGDPFTVAQINTEFQTRVGPYYQEVSYGQQLLNITVATSGGGWLNAGVPTPANCDWATAGNLADAAATAAGYSINSYQNRYYVMTSNGACGWAGLAYVGFGRAWSNGVNALWVYGHELGHNFGLWHSGSVGCGAQVLGGSCGVSEYGDPFDVMGNIRQMHFNTKQKSVLNWIPSTSVKIHTSGTQTYQLSPLETGSQSTYAVKIPTSSTTRTYWVEFRQPIGFDSPLSSLPNLGAQIRVSAPFEYTSGSDDTEILDMTPGSGGGFDDATLLQGQTYVDSVYGVTINVISATPGPSGLLTVSVAMGGNTPTTTTLSSSLNPSTVGTSVTFTASVTGTAPTGSVNFTDGGTTISGCGAVALSGGAGNTRTAACSTAALSSGTRTIVAAYSGNGANNASSSSPLSQVVNKTATTTALSSSANPSTVGTSVTFTASVTGNGPTGTLNFTDGGTTIGGCGAAALAGVGNTRTAVCSTAALTLGTHTIVAAYSGDGANTVSSSGPLSQTVNKVVSSTTLGSSSNPANSGANVIFTALVSGSVPTGGVAFTDGGVTIVGCSAVALAGGGNTRTTTCTTSTLSGGTHSIVASYSGDPANTASSSTLVSEVINTTTTVWVEDAVPAGAVVGGNGESWNWVSANPSPFSGALAHQSAVAAGYHQHYFYSATATLAVGVGDTLSTYIYLDPANPPSEVMLQWYDGSWEHRAYWGANLIGLGTDGSASRRYMGALPSTGQWVRLAVPAVQLGLEGHTLSGMAFSLYDGRATWDYASKSSAWVGDAVPTGAGVGGNGESWNWVSANPTPYSGALAHQSAVAAGFHQHYFYLATDTLAVGVGDILFTYVYLDPANPPSEVMLQWYDGSWEHRAYWGPNLIGLGIDGSSSRRSMGALPPTGQWVRLAVPAVQLGLEGHTLSGMAFSLYDGRATWDYASKSSAWVGDAVPTGAGVGGNGESWNWVSANPTPYSGALAHQSAVAAGYHQHYFFSAADTLAVGVGDTLFTYVYLDPANPPSEVMLQWYDGSWEHRAYWGPNLIGLGIDGSSSRRSMGALPPTGQWVRLAVPAAQLGLEGHALNGMAFTLYDGRATWDSTGK